MDREKNHGKKVEEIEYLVASNGVPGVIDLQHLYEVALDNGDSLDTLARNFAEAMLRHHGITHLHVSGEVSEGGIQIVKHAQLTIATNRKAILNALDTVFSTTKKSGTILTTVFLPSIIFHSCY